MTVVHTYHATCVPPHVLLLCLPVMHLEIAITRSHIVDVNDLPRVPEYEPADLARSLSREVL